jgi:hypothetical protein
LISILKIPIANAVNNDRDRVARTFSNHDFLLNSPIIKSREVRAMKGPLKFPLRDNKAGIIKINKRKLLNETINRERTIPARISPTMETISDGKVSLMILPLVSRASICHHHHQMNLKLKFHSFSLILNKALNYLKVPKHHLIFNIEIKIQLTLLILFIIMIKKA